MCYEQLVCMQRHILAKLDCISSVHERLQSVSVDEKQSALSHASFEYWIVRSHFLEALSHGFSCCLGSDPLFLIVSICHFSTGSMPNAPTKAGQQQSSIASSRKRLGNCQAGQDMVSPFVAPTHHSGTAPLTDTCTSTHSQPKWSICSQCILC